MTQPITIVVLSTGLDNFKDIRRALTAELRVKLLAGGNDPDQLYEEIVRLKPNAAIVALGAMTDQAVNFIERLGAECPSTAIISAGDGTSPDLILRSLRAGAREFLLTQDFHFVVTRVLVDKECLRIPRYIPSIIQAANLRKRECPQTPAPLGIAYAG